MYNALSEIPIPQSAQFVSSSAVQVTHQIRDNVRDIKRSLTSTIVFSTDTPFVTPAADVGDIVLSAFAPLGTISYGRQAILRQTSEKKRFVEIWKDNALEVVTEVTDTHGEFYADPMFSALSFSPLDTALAYVAEGKEPTEPEEKFRLKPTLGETYSGKQRPTIFVFRWGTDDSTGGSAGVSTGLPLLFGEPVFSPIDSSIIYATGYEYARDGRLLGPVYCNNRAAGIWEITLQANTARKLTPGNESCRSPRAYNRGGKTLLFWYSTASGGPHAGTSALNSLELPVQQDAELSSLTRVLVDTVWAQPSSADVFPGLYPDANLAQSSCLVSACGVDYIVLSSTWGSRGTVLAVSLSTGTVEDLTPDVDGRLYHWSVLGTDGGSQIICSRSAPAVPPEIVLLRLGSTIRDVYGQVLQTPKLGDKVKAALQELSSTVIIIPERGGMQTVVMHPKKVGSTIPPCIHFIHGGPHGATATAFNAATVALAVGGYTVSQPNYHGSMGQGETFLRSLLGHCGELDVQDCIASTMYLVKLGLSSEGRGKQFVMGGSHGGFLTAHLIGQFPDFFTAAVLRNPVITTEAMSSDIPDWYANEWGIDYPIYSLPQGFPDVSAQPRTTLPPRRSPEAALRIYPTSPIAHAEKVKAHILMHLGGSDLRVTPSHGLEFYHTVKGNARNSSPEQGVEMYWFDKENHALGGVECARIVAKTSLDWFDKYRNWF
ncbi:unnamed protein product [Mycena citricolor]|uniref:acylaminoacyl-peptidase n=1 Tax=Mycena citricolor TaxID=2018698 RepID=A0AAD2HTU0_9AGAR|nr:unnamed protein product [Mycena citricolor]